MIKHLFTLLLWFSCFSTFAQSDTLNFNFEQIGSNHKPTSWQLDIKDIPGMGGYLFTLDSIFKASGKYSLRMEKDPQHPEAVMGGFKQNIPVNFSGKAIKVKGKVYSEDLDGWGGFLFFVKDSSGNVQEMRNFQQIKQDNGVWKEYELTAPLYPNSKTLEIGGALFQSGRVWIDDLKVYVDDQPLETAMRAGSASHNDSALDPYPQTYSLNAQQVDNLYYLGKIWGFLKYFHPGVSSGTYNWDKELLNMLKSNIEVTDKDEFQRRLLDWILTYKTEIPRADPRKKAIPSVLSWISNDKALADGIKKELVDIYNSSGEREGFYVKQSNVGNALITNEDPYKYLANPSSFYRILALYRYWNYIEYFFPAKHLITNDWNSILRKYLPPFASLSGNSSYTLNIAKLTVEIQDSHGLVHYESVKAHFGKYTLPVRLVKKGSRLLVTDVFPTSEDLQNSLKTGDEVALIDGKTVDEYLNPSLQYTSTSNIERGYYQILNRGFLRFKTKFPSLKVIRNGKTLQVQTTAVAPGKILQITPKRELIKALSSDVYYLNLGELHYKQVDSVFNVLPEKAHLIIDSRNYPNSVWSKLSAYFLDQPQFFANYYIPDFDSLGELKKVAISHAGEQASYKFRGKVIVLVNSSTISQAEFTVMALQTSPKVKVWGSMTAGADGDVVTAYLPGGYPVTFSGAEVTYPDGTRTQKLGIKIDKRFKSWETYPLGEQDYLLMTAIDYLKKD